MSYRIQFTISDSEKLKLEEAAKEGGYPDITTLAKERTLAHPLESLKVYNIALSRIEKLPYGKEFRLSQVVDGVTAPVVGSMFNKALKNGTFNNNPNLQTLRVSRGDSQSSIYIKDDPSVIIDTENKLNSFIDEIIHTDIKE